MWWQSPSLFLPFVTYCHWESWSLDHQSGKANLAFHWLQLSGEQALHLIWAKQ